MLWFFLSLRVIILEVGVQPPLSPGLRRDAGMLAQHVLDSVGAFPKQPASLGRRRHIHLSVDRDQSRGSGLSGRQVLERLKQACSLCFQGITSVELGHQSSFVLEALNG